MRSRRKDFKKYLEAFRLAAQANLRFPAETWVTPALRSCVALGERVEVTGEPPQNALISPRELLPKSLSAGSKPSSRSSIARGRYENAPESLEHASPTMQLSRRDERGCSPDWMAILEELLRAGTAAAGRRAWAFRDAKRGGGALVDFPARF